MTTETNIAETLNGVFRELHGAQITQIVTPDMTVPVLQHPTGIKLSSIKSLIDEYRQAPERRKGSALVQTLTSFIDHANRFKDDDSAIFASRDVAQPKLTAVLNYHRAGAASPPRFGDHRTVFAFPLSEEWQAWTKIDGAKMDQGEFAAFIEDRLTDLLPAPDLSNPATDAEKQLAAFAELTQGAFATPQRMAELARGLTVHVGERVKQAVNLSSGEAQIQYEAEHTDTAGAPLRVPSLVLIGIPVFDQGSPYRIPVRLRYRVVGGQLVWFFNLYRAARVFTHAVEEAALQAAQQTQLPLIWGNPE